jgi:hypothetical protein
LVGFENKVLIGSFFSFLLDEVSDLLIPSVQEGFCEDFGSFELRVLPVDFWGEGSTPGVAKDKAIFSEVGDIESLSFFLVSSYDHEVACMGDGAMSVEGSVHIEHRSGSF